MIPADRVEAEAYFRRRRRRNALRRVGHYVWQRLRKNSCKQKARFTEEEALAAAERVWQRFNDRQQAYPCIFCAHWHLGHAPRSKGTTPALNALRQTLHLRLIRLLEQRRREERGHEPT